MTWASRLGAATVMMVAFGEADAQQIFVDGFEESCLVNTDGDRLPNCVEVDRALEYGDEDTDDDGIRDGDEVLGTLAGLNLPALGLDPRRKDLLLEHDWVVDQNGCSSHSHRPSAAALQQISAVFAAAPIANPDGSLGIHVIHDVGQSPLLVGGSLVSLPEGTIQEDLDSDYFSRRSNNFDSRRIGYFHYVLHAHRYTTFPNSTGYAEILGDDIIVSMQCEMATDAGAWARNTLLHELGHNLGLRHGGDTNCNHKPNYNSVMNYDYQRAGVDTDCDSLGDAVMDFSAGTRVAIDEGAIDERVGVCGTIPIDWNKNSVFDFGLARDLNAYATEVAECGGTHTTLTDFADWSHVLLTGLSGAPGGGEAVVQEVGCQDVP